MRPRLETPFLEPKEKQRSSFIRLRPESAARAFRELLANDHVGFTASYLFLQKLADAEHGHPFAGAAIDLVRTRVAELTDLRDALEQIHAVADDPRVEAMLAPDRPLAAFLKGLYVWTDGIMNAF